MSAREPRSDCSRQGHNNNTLAATCRPLYLHHLRTERGKLLKPDDETSYKEGHSVILSECNCPEMLKNQTQFHLNVTAKKCRHFHNYKSANVCGTLREVHQ